MFVFNKNRIDEKLVLTKRKYTEQYPEQKHSTYAPVRSKVLEFIDRHGIVSKNELKEFLNQFQESTGRNTSFSWIKKNSSLIKQTTNEYNDVGYTLTNKGRRVLERTRQLMENNNMILTENEYKYILLNINEYRYLTEDEFVRLFNEVVHGNNKLKENDFDFCLGYFVEDIGTLTDVSNKVVYLNKNGIKKYLSYF